MPYSKSRQEDVNRLLYIFLAALPLVYSSFICTVLKISKHPCSFCAVRHGYASIKNSDTVRDVITYLQYRCFPVDSIYNNRSHNYHSLCETKQNIFLYTTMLYRVFDLLRFSGVDGSRTRVQKPIPCPSTSVVYFLTFPPRPGNKHPEHFSSFMLRPYAQSFAYVVSHMFEAGILRCECPRADCCH